MTQGICYNVLITLFILLKIPRTIGVQCSPFLSERSKANATVFVADNLNDEFVSCVAEATSPIVVLSTGVLLENLQNMEERSVIVVHDGQLSEMAEMVDRVYFARHIWMLEHKLCVESFINVASLQANSLVYIFEVRYL